MKPVKLKAMTLADVIASAKAKAEAFEKLSPEEKAKQLAETKKILEQLGPGLAAVIIKP